MRLTKTLLNVVALIALTLGAASTASAVQKLLVPKQDTATGLYGYVDAIDRWKIKPKFTNASPFFSASKYSKQCAWVSDADNMKTLINEKGKTVLPDKYYATGEPAILSAFTAMVIVQKTKDGPMQVIVINDKKVKELPEQFTNIQFLCKQGARRTFILTNNGVKQDLTIQSNTGETTVKPIDLDIIGEPFRGLIVINKNGKKQLLDYASNRYYDLEQFGKAWKTQDNIVSHYHNNIMCPVYLDKDYNILGSYFDPRRKAKYVYFDNPAFEPSGNAYDEAEFYPLLNIETGELVGKFYYLELFNNGFAEITKPYLEEGSTDSSSREFYHGYLNPNGKVIVPAVYETIVKIVNDPGKPEYVAAQAKNGIVDIFDTDGNKVSSLPHGYSYLVADFENRNNGIERYSKEFIVRSSGIGRDYYTIDGKMVSPPGCSKMELRYDKDGNHIGWIAKCDRVNINYDRNMKPISSVSTVKPKKDIEAEVYKRRDFTGRPLGIIDGMKDRGFVKAIKGISDNHYGATMEITLKDGSRYRIETNSNAIITKARKIK